eukprot:tig00000140_g8476.t1
MTTQAGVDHGEVLNNFIMVTGCEDTDQALQILQICDWNMENAVNMFFEGGIHGGGGRPSAGRAADEDMPYIPPEEDVRAPIPATEGVLVDHGFGSDAYYRNYRNPAPQPIVDAFRDFRREAEERSAAAGHPPPSSSVGPIAGIPATLGISPSASPPPRVDTGLPIDPLTGLPLPPRSRAAGGGLQDLFRAPTEIMFAGNFMQAKAQALSEKRWLLVNIQSESEFASHQLNRDVWANPGIQQLVSNHFVFMQKSSSEDDGQRFLTFYKNLQLPCICIIDPRTGQLVEHWDGFVDAEELNEHLQHFLAHSPALTEAEPPPPPKKSRAREELTEEEQVAMAIAQSLGQSYEPPERAPEETRARSGPSSRSVSESGPSGGGGGPRFTEERAIRRQQDMEYEESLRQDQEKELEKVLRLSKEEAEKREAEEAERQLAEQAKAAAAAAEAAAERKRRLLASLPSEPPATDKGATRLMIRMPDGSRVQRRFNPTDRLQVLFDFVEGSVEEDFAGLEIVTLQPRKTYDDPAATFLDSGLHPQAAVVVNRK